MTAEQRYERTISDFSLINPLLGAFALLVYTSPRLTLLILALVPALAIGAVVYGRRIRRLSRRVRHRGWHPGASQHCPRRRLRTLRLRPPRVDQHPGDEHTDRRPRPRRPRAARLPDLEAGAARDRDGAPGRAPAAGHESRGVRRVQARRHPVRARGGRHPVPRTGHARRLRCLVPRAAERVLRVFRAVGVSRRRVAAGGVAPGRNRRPPARAHARGGR